MLYNTIHQTYHMPLFRLIYALYYSGANKPELLVNDLLRVLTMLGSIVTMLHRT